MVHSGRKWCIFQEVVQVNLSPLSNVIPNAQCPFCTLPPNAPSQVTPMVTTMHAKIADEVYFRLHLIPIMEFYKRSSRTSLLGDQHISRPLRRLR